MVFPAMGHGRIFALHPTILALTKREANQSDPRKELTERESGERGDNTYLHAGSGLPGGGGRHLILRRRQK